MNRKFFYPLTLLLFYLCLPTALLAQGMVTEIKIIAVQDYEDLAALSGGYNGDGSADLDFRKGRGGGAVFAIFKNSSAQSDTVKYITDVVVTASRGDNYGLEYSDGKKKYTPAHFYQEEKKHKDNTYRGGLNGRDYWIYGGAYKGQDHVYVCRTGNTDFSQRVLREAKVVTSNPKSLNGNQTKSGGHAGGGRYFIFTWHYHDSKFKATGDVTTHEHYCGSDNCGLFKVEKHNFDKRYGNDIWGQLQPNDPKCAESHYKKCVDCGQIVYDKHNFATYVSNWTDHTKRCLVCGYIEKADHKGFGRQKLPVDEISHIIYCDDCQFLQKLPHDYTYSRIVRQEDCDLTLVEYTCSQCYHSTLFEEPGLGHDYNAFGICTRSGCLHPYQRPATEPFGSGGDSAFVIRNYGNLYWISDYVNNRRPKTNIRLDNDLVAEDFLDMPWRPIGAADSSAFQGTFDGGGHVISMLRTEEPVAGCGYRGLFGAVGKDASVSNLTIAACNMRGWDYIGAVAGVNEGTISGCRVLFSVMNSISSGMNLGGICGLNKGTVRNCTTENSVWVGGVRDYAGGICGTNAGGNLSGNVSQAICGSGSDAVLPEAASQQ